MPPLAPDPGPSGFSPPPPTPSLDETGAEPFATVAEALFWFLPAYEQRHAGARFKAGLGDRPRPCEPLDVLRVIDRLHKQRRLTPDHVRTLGHYARRQSPPNPRNPAERRADRIWREAVDRLAPPLRAKGIVAAERLGEMLDDPARPEALRAGAPR